MDDFLSNYRKIGHLSARVVLRGCFQTRGNNNYGFLGMNHDRLIQAEFAIVTARAQLINIMSTTSTVHTQDTLTKT